MNRNGRTYPPVMDRIADRTSYEDRGFTSLCLIYHGGKGRHGYGVITHEGRKRGVHRVTYEALVGPIPDGLELDHLCRQHDCCEHTHLEAVTHAENTRRGIAGEVARRRAAAVTHCPKGHEYTPENTVMRPHSKSGHLCRFCRQCSRDWASKTHARKRAARLAAMAVICLALMGGVADAGSNARQPDPEPAPLAYPESPCNLANRMNIEIVDGMLWECSCYRLQYGYQCDWFLIAGVETPAEARRLKVKRAAKKGWHLAAPALSRVPA